MEIDIFDSDSDTGPDPEGSRFFGVVVGTVHVDESNAVTVYHAGECPRDGWRIVRGGGPLLQREGEYS